MLGGTPVREKFLDFSRPVLTADEKQAVMDVLDSGWLTTGAKSSEFERKFAQYTGVKHAIAVNSCTAGLFLILSVLDVKAGDEVITSPNTFPATANVIEHLGAKPVFCDINLADGNIDADKIIAAITPNTKGIIPVHYAGASCDMDTIQSIAEQFNLFILGDCAHAVETTWNGNRVGSLGIASSFSFYATKNLTTGEGGMVTTNDDEIYRKIKVLRLHGLSDDAESRYTKNGGFGYDLIVPGYKFNMPDILASLGIAQLSRIGERHQKRVILNEHYRELLSKIDNVNLLEPAGKNTHAHHLLPILIDFTKLTCEKNEFMSAMKSENIGISQHFKPLHLYSYYRDKYGYSRGDYLNAEKFGDQILTLPFNQYLHKSDIQDVVAALKKTIEYYII